MKNLFFLAIIASTSPLTSFAEDHRVEFGIADKNFSWEEFSEFKERLINTEDGSLSSLNLGYSYRNNNDQISLNISSAKGTVDYLGERRNSVDHVKYPTTSDYQIKEFEVAYGRYLDTDYITPFAYLSGGYQSRERIINPFPQQTLRNAEEYSFYFWSLGLDADIFNWNNFSINSGIYFKNYTMGEVESVDKGFSKPLKQLRVTGYKLGIAYRFLGRYQTSINYLKESGSMARSATYDYQTVIDDINNVTLHSTQPESEQEISQISLKFSIDL